MLFAKHAASGSQLSPFGGNATATSADARVDDVAGVQRSGTGRFSRCRPRTACTSRSNQQRRTPDRYRPSRPTGPVALAFFGERRGCTPRTRLRGPALAAAGSCVGAGPRQWFAGATGPIDETRLSKTGFPCARTAGGIRGRASPLRSNVARCACSLRSRLRVSSRGRTVAPEPRPFASRGSPQSLGARRARIATADREEPLCPRSRRSACRYEAMVVVVQDLNGDTHHRFVGGTSEALSGRKHLIVASRRA